MTSKRPQLDEPDWGRLIDTERELESAIAAAQADAAADVAAARARDAAADADPALTAALAAEQERTDTERHARELAQGAEAADALVRRLELAPQTLVDSLAEWVLDAAMSNVEPTGPR